MKKKLYNFLFPTSVYSLKRDVTWNTFAGLLNAIEAVALLAVVTRVCGVEEAGYLSIAFAVANLFVAVGKYGVRYFQVTNCNTPISLESYRNMRVITIAIMLFFCFLYIVNGKINNGYSWYKMCVVVLMCIIYAVESMEDTYWGYLQRENKLASGAKVFILRWLSILLIINIGLFLGCNLLESLLAATICSWVIYLFCMNLVRKECDYKKSRWDWGQIKLLFIKCTPLALGVFFNYYICNAPKYSIDTYMSDEIQAYYGYIAMPVFLIQLLSNFIFHPMLVKISNYWNTGEYEKFKISILKQYITIVALTIICLIGTWRLGVPILSIIYGTNLSQYSNELLILMLGGGFLAFDGFLNIVLTVMDARKDILIGYGVSAILSLLLLPYIVNQYGVLGATIEFCGILFLLSLYFNVRLWSYYFRILDRK